MSKLKSAIVTGVAVAGGLVTVRKLRERRRTPRQEAAEATRKAVEEAALAAKHGVAAAGHARVAGGKAAESARGEYEKRRVGERTADAPADTEGGSGSRLREAGVALIRR